MMDDITILLASSVPISSSRVLHRSRCTLRMLRNATSRGLARWGKTFNLHPLTWSYSSLHGADTYSGGSILEGLHTGVTFAGFPRTKPSRFRPVAKYSRNCRDDEACALPVVFGSLSITRSILSNQRIMGIFPGVKADQQSFLHRRASYTFLYAKESTALKRVGMQLVANT